MLLENLRFTILKQNSSTNSRFDLNKKTGNRRTSRRISARPCRYYTLA